MSVAVAPHSRRRSTLRVAPRVPFPRCVASARSRGATVWNHRRPGTPWALVQHLPPLNWDTIDFEIRPNKKPILADGSDFTSENL